MSTVRLKLTRRTVRQMKKYLPNASALLVCLLLLPLAAHASPFDSGISSIQTLFTGTIAKAAALIAIVIGGFGFAFGEPGAKKNLAGVAMGSGIAVLAANVLTWLWGV